MQHEMNHKTLRPMAVPAAIAVAIALLLVGCKSAPVYEKPAMTTPAAFKEASAAYWQQANPKAGEVPDDWWHEFNDPVLNWLEGLVRVGNEDIRASVARYRQAQAALASSRASLFPTLGAGLSASRSSSGSGTSSTTSTSRGPDNSYALTANASWEVDLWGRLAATVDSADARLQASQADVSAARLSVQATLAQTYFSLRSTEAQIALLDRTIEAYQRSLTLTQNRYKAGVAASSDVAQAQSQLKSTQAQRVEAASSRGQLEHAISVLVGKTPAEFNVPVTGRLPRIPEAPVQLPATLLERRPDIAAAERRVAAANAQIGVARAAFFPALTLSASAGYRGSSFGDLVTSPNFIWSLGPALALSIFDGGARQAAVDSARASTDEAASNYRKTVLTAFQEVEDNLIIGSSLAEEATLQSEALDAARKALEVTENQYRAGTVSFLNVVSAQATVLSAERSVLDIRTRRLAAANQLLKNIGGRWDAPVQSAPAAAAAAAAPDTAPDTAPRVN